MGEGGYKVTDKPRPRGELIIGGKCVAKGYFKSSETINEDFLIQDGQRWFRTGDIGEVDPEGRIKIIDRKKDLVKLALGEYVSLGKVEAIMKTHPLVDNICVHADPFNNFTVAVLVPIQGSLENLALKLRKNLNFSQLCVDRELQKEVLKILYNHGEINGLKKFEIPRTVHLTPNVWTPDTNLVTAAFKIRRKMIYNVFEKEFQNLYDEEKSLME